MKSQLNALPIDIIRPICYYLTIESIASLYATFDRRLQKLLVFSGFPTSIVVDCTTESGLGAISYLFKSMPIINSLEVVSNQGLNMPTLLGLSKRSSLSSLSFFLQITDIERYLSDEEYMNDQRMGDLPFHFTPVYTVLNLNSLFPFVTDLALNMTYYTLISQKYSTEAASQTEAMVQALSYFPRKLTRLDLVLSGIEALTIVDVVKQLPSTIVDLCIDLDGTLTDSISLPEMLIKFCKNVKHLRLLFKFTLFDKLPFAPRIRTLGHPLETLEMSSFQTVATLSDRYWRWSSFPNITSITMGFGGGYTTEAVDLSETLPNLLTLKLFKVGSNQSGAIIADFPKSLTYLEISEASWSFDYLLVHRLKQLPCLHSFVEKGYANPTFPNANPTFPIPFDLLPESLTYLHTEQLGLVEHHKVNPYAPRLPMTDAELEEYTRGGLTLLTMSCPISSFRYLQAFHRTHPKCHVNQLQRSTPSNDWRLITTENVWTTEDKSVQREFSDASWRKLEDLGAFDGLLVSDEQILNFVSEQLGPSINASLSFPIREKALLVNQRPLVQTLKMGGTKLSKNGITIHFETLNPYFVANFPSLTELDISTNLDLLPYDMLWKIPKTLTSLNFRDTPFTVSDALELPLLVRFSALAKVSLSELPSKPPRNWIVFDTPNLSLPQRLLPLILNENLEILRCCISTLVPDIELKKIIEDHPNTEMTLKCSLLLTGGVSDASTDQATYQSISDYAYNYFSKGDIAISDLTMRRFCFPDGIVSIDLDSLDAPSNFNIRGELIRKLPTTLKRLHLSNAGVEISWQKLAAILPPTLEELFYSPSSSAQEIGQISALLLPNLTTLNISWPGPSQERLEFDFTSMVYLTNLQLVNIELGYPLSQAISTLKNLRFIKVVKANDDDIRIVFQDLPNIEKVVLDTLILSGMCVPEEERLDWVTFAKTSMESVPPMVQYNSVALLQPLSFRQTSINELCFKHEDADLLSDKGELSDLIRNSEFSLLSELPPGLTHLEFSSSMPSIWSAVSNILSSAVNLKIVKLFMEIDFTISAGKNVLPPALEILIMPKAFCKKKGGAELGLPNTMKELYAPLLTLNASARPIPLIDELVVANLAMVRRYQSMAKAKRPSSSK